MLDEKSTITLPELTNIGQLLHGTTLKRELVTVPEWGLSIWVWELTGEELDAYRSYIWTEKGGKVRMSLTKLRAQTARLLAVAVRDANGKRMFDDHTGPDRLLAMGASGLERLAKVARKLSGLDEDDDEESEGNSAAGQTGSFNGTSPSLSTAPVESSSVG